MMAGLQIGAEPALHLDDLKKCTYRSTASEERVAYLISKTQMWARKIHEVPSSPCHKQIHASGDHLGRSSPVPEMEMEIDIMVQA
jgi:hypothetical protein